MIISRKKKKIAVIGIGGIGLRHLQSCANLPFDEYEIYGVDINSEVIKKAQTLLKSDHILYVQSLNFLPIDIDVVIVATQANVRATIVQELIASKSVETLILEKVLFQKIEDYEKIKLLINANNISCFVNCPRRIWPAYVELKRILEEQNIASININGTNWDLGCNAIHYIDLIGFLAESDSYQITDHDFTDCLEESKRAGSFFINGELKGIFNNFLIFKLSTLSGADDCKIIKIKLVDGTEVVVEENTSSIKIIVPNDEIQEFSIPFQSVLTEKLILKKINEDKCDLTSYEESKNLHLPLMQTLLSHFKKSFKDIEGCPIT